MFRSPFFRRLFLPYLVLICIATGAVGAFAAYRLRTSYMENRRQNLRDDIKLVSELIQEHLSADQFQQLGRHLANLGHQIGYRITIIAPDGTVLADNWADPAHMANHRDRPEIQAALAQGDASSTRASETLHEDMLYIAHRLSGPDQQAYILRLAVRLSDLARERRLLYAGLGAVALAAIAVTGLICYGFARRHTAPILELTDLAKALARGHLERRAALSGNGEIATLGAALNTMADSLRNLLAQADKDKAELLAILSSMSEGVVATDAAENVLVANEAAATLLGFAASTAPGKPLWQIIRQDQLIKAAEAALKSGRRNALEMGPIAGRHLEIFLSPYPTRGRVHGLVLVVHDATESRRYQELRKEFVANVSHELRTPLSVVKGFVETLQEGAMADPVKGPEYLATIERHTNQLSNLVNDLLELSRLESQPDLPRRQPVDIAALARKTLELLLPAAQRKHQTLTSQVERLPLILGNPDYLERAIANLIDNAIKYTPEAGHIALSARANASNIIIEVSDDGIGIPKEDLPRIFERFYRVDRSRSREMGGTGLGLSIVKHVVQAHGGTVEVESHVGQGSLFRFKIPLTAAPPD